MKPIGMSCDLRVIRPTTAEDAIWRAVQEAQCEGVTWTEFVREAILAWREEQRIAARESEQETGDAE